MSARTLDYTQCKEYLRKIIDLELSCYKQERMLEILKSTSGRVRREIDNLEKTNEKIPVKPANEGASLVLAILSSVFVALIGAIAGVGISIIIKLLYCLVRGLIEGQIVGLIAGFFDFFRLAWLPFIKWGAITGYIVGFLFLLYCHFNKTTRRNGKEARDSYEQRLEAYEKSQQMRQQKLEEKKHEYFNEIPKTIVKFENEYKKTRELLKKYYDLGYIYPKYRGLVPVCSLYEYLDSRRCTSLIGHEGAYNIYEMEVRLNRICAQLDEVIYRLDEISANQRQLSLEIRQCNAQLSRISNSLDSIENNTALTQYYSGITASNTTFMSWLAAFSYDEMHRNRSDF